MNNLEIGGRNYIISNKLSSYTTYNSKPSYNNGIISTTFSSSYTPNNDGSSYLTLSITGYTPPNEIMTLSGYIKVNGEIPESNYFISRLSTYNNGDPIVMTYDGTTGYFIYTQKYVGNSNWIIHAKVNRNTQTADVVTFEKLKFEKGSKATDWTLAPEDVDNNILNASKTATNYMSVSASGLIIGDMTAETLGKNVLIDSDSVDIRNNTTTLASFGANTIYLGKNSETSVINLCNGAATMRVQDDVDFKIYTDKRLVMSAYKSMLLDCYRDSTHQTRISIQSSDPDDASFVGGVQFTIYQDNIENTVRMLKNNIELQVTDGTNETRFNVDEKIIKMYAADIIRLNSTSRLQIGEASTYTATLLLGNSYNRHKSVDCYWGDNAIHEMFATSADGKSFYIGPPNIELTDSSVLNTITYVRGRNVRLYAHTGGAVYLGSSGSTTVTSDRNMKKDILDIDDKYIDFFDRLRPITYKYTDGHRDHIGFVAQEVEEALNASGLTTEQFAGLVIDEDIILNPNYEESSNNDVHYDKLYSLRYEEFISLLVKKVQDLQRQVNELKGE